MHEGHRKRMYSRLEKGDTLYDHEVLEILLYNAYPRINTNEIASSLIGRFGSLSEVLRAPVSELVTVKGVGENAAYFLRSVGACAQRANFMEGVANLRNFGDFKRFTALRMRGRQDEHLELYFIDKAGTLNRICSFTSRNRESVKVNVGELVKIISSAKPYAMFVAHNHLNGNSLPSSDDDLFTKQLQVLCSMNDVKLYDHCIYCSDNDIYSYHESGKIDEILREYTAQKILGKWIKN